MPPFYSSEDLMLSCPFSGISEKVSSKSYFYDNSRRGEDCFVIIQRTESGRGVFQSGRRRDEVPPGFAFVAVVPERSRYYFEASKPWVFTWINFYGGLALDLARAIRDAHGPVVPFPSDGEVSRIFYSLAEGAAAKSRDPWKHSARCFEFFSTLKGALARPAGAGIDPADTAAGIMEQRFREPLCVKEIAAQVGLTREHLSRLFAQRHGAGPAAYLRAIRARQAGRLLLEEKLSLREIALRSGFPSVAALRRAGIEGRGGPG